MKLALLIGNSTLRWATVDGRRVLESRRLAWRDVAGNAFGALREALSAGPEEVVVGSVRDDRLDSVLAALGAHVPALRVAGRDFEVAVENRYTVPGEAGLDRLLNVVAARALFPGVSVVVLDFGTALSVTAVSPQGAFLGGLIGVGAASAAAALETGTPQLPAAGTGPADTFIQTSTEAGIRAGVFWQLAGGAQRILEGVRAELPRPVRCVATGGDAPLFAGAVRDIDRVDGDLTLRGLAIAAETASR